MGKRSCSSDGGSGEPQRAELLGVLAYLVTKGHTRPMGVRWGVRAAACTPVNRLLAIGIADSLSVPPPTPTSWPSSSA